MEQQKNYIIDTNVLQTFVKLEGTKTHYLRGVS